MKHLFFLILLALFVFPAFSQESSSPEQLRDDGFFFFNAEDYEEAIFYLLRLEDTPLMDANVAYRIGVCYLHISGEEHRAIPYLEKALDNLSGRYNARSIKETRAPYHTWFHLGQAYRINNELGKALEAFEAFRQVPAFEKRYNLSMVNNEISACEIAKIITDIPVTINMVNMGSMINNASDNYYPVLSADERSMVYMTDLKFYNGIFMTTRTGNTWSEPVNITPQVESDGNAYPVFLTANGKTLYLINGTGNSRDIFVSYFRDGFWTKMEPLGPVINSPRAEAFASLSPDENTLFFTSNRRGGYGGFDIYSSRKLPNGEWGQPENLGPVINTPYDEASPYLSNDGTTLFFTSEGHYNMGGFDIFYSVTDENNQWKNPVNIGFPINTTADNMFFYPVKNGKFGYVARILPEGYGGLDIYRIERIEADETGPVFTGEIETESDITDLNEGFVVRILDAETGKTVTEIVYDPVDKTFRFRSATGAYHYKIERE